MSVPNLGTIVIYGNWPGIVAITNASWTDALDPEHTDNPIAQPTVDQVGVFLFSSYGDFPFPTIVNIADLTYPAYQVQAT